MPGLKGRNLSLWFGMMTAPVAWLFSLQIGFMAVPWACAEGGQRWPVHAVAFCGLGIALAGTFQCWRSWRKSGADWPGDGDSIEERDRTLAMIGLLFSLLICLVLAAQATTNFLLNPCQ